MTSKSIWLDIHDAIACLWFWKYRTSLSALGIAIGTTALIVMLSISEGARLQAEKNIKGLGIDTLRLESKTERFLSLAQAKNLAVGVTKNDLKSLSFIFPDATLGAFHFVKEQRLIVGGIIVTADIMFINQAWLDAESIGINTGRSFMPQDLAMFKQVCLLGADLAHNVKINTIASWQGRSCETIGTLNNVSQRIIEGSVLASIDINNLLIFPLEYNNELSELTGITIKLHSGQVSAAYKELSEYLNSSHAVQDYEVFVPATLLAKAEQERFTFNLIMGTIAGLSLIVGGIGILNVMLAKVAEQTREIGLRKTFGADNKRIFQLFMSYSIMLSAVGTFIGVVIGLLSAAIIQLSAEWPVSFSVFSVSAGPIFAIFSGVLAGLYPAYRASQLSPTQALRTL
jgi:putative ABC transport system permease protein